MPFNSIKKFFERNSSLLAGVCCLLFAGLSLLGKLLELVLSSDGAFYLQLVEIWRNAGHYDAVPAAIPDSDKILNTEITPVLLTWVHKQHLIGEPLSEQYQDQRY